MIPRRLCNSHAWLSMIQLSEWVWNHHCGKLELHFARGIPVSFLLVLMRGLAWMASLTTWMFSADLPVRLWPECPLFLFKLVPWSAYFLTLYQMALFVGGCLSGNCTRKASWTSTKLLVSWYRVTRNTLCSIVNCTMFGKYVKCACVTNNLCWSCYVIIGLTCDKKINFK